MIPIFGLTGNIGSGKSTVAEMLVSFADVIIFEADQIAKDIMAEQKEKLLAMLGSDIFTDNNLDFKKLGTLLFSDPDKKKAVEAMIHPLVWQKVQDETEKLPPTAVVIVESALIYEVKHENNFRAVILVICELEEAIRRVMVRNSCTKEEVEKRLAAQLPVEYKKTRAQFVIVNNGSLNDLRVKAEEVYGNIKKYYLRR